MNKYFSYLVVILITITACVRESLQVEDSEIKTFNCFRASVEDSEMTKVYIGETGSVKWEVGDSIGIFSDIHSPVPYYLESDGKFRGEDISGKIFYAYYPYDPDMYNKENPTVLCPDDFSGRWIMVAKSSDNNLMFKQTGGMLHFVVKCDAEGVDGIIRPNHYEWIGKGEINLEDSIPQFVSNGFGIEAGYCILSSNSYKGEDGYWHIFVPMPVVTLSNGFTIRFARIKGDDVAEYSCPTYNVIVISRGVIKTFPCIDLDSEIEHDRNALASDRTALVALYNALGGANWTIKNNWCTDAPLDQWDGIQVNASGRVISINLSGNKLKGHIPEEIGSLDRLEALSLGDDSYPEYEACEITGSIPESIGNLTHLKRLEIMPSMLTGEFPSSIVNLKSLEILSIPGKINLFNGKSLGYRMSGEIGFICELPLLRVIDLSGHEFSGPLHERFASKYLSDINVCCNKLTGPLPDLSNQVGDLRRVYFQANQFTGSVPSGFASVMDKPHLDDFWFFSNNISGPLPDGIINHPKFADFAHMFLTHQNDGYELTIDKVPASRSTYETFDGNYLNLGEQYSNAAYTMIVRWAEWCPSTASFLPTALSLADQYKDKGLQTIWAYGGGNEEERVAFMKETGLDKLSPHIIECHGTRVYDKSVDKAIWTNWLGYRTPFVEIVDNDGNIVFIDDKEGYYSYLPFSFKRNDLELFLSNLLNGD